MGHDGCRSGGAPMAISFSDFFEDRGAKQDAVFRHVRGPMRRTGTSAGRMHC